MAFKHNVQEIILEKKWHRKSTVKSKGIFPYRNIFERRNTGQKVQTLRKKVPKCDSKIKEVEHAEDEQKEKNGMVIFLK